MCAGKVPDGTVREKTCGEVKAEEQAEGKQSEQRPHLTSQGQGGAELGGAAASPTLTQWDIPLCLCVDKFLHAGCAREGDWPSTNGLSSAVASAQSGAQ